MFGIGGGELMFIIFIALMLFGSDKIPDIARTLGKGMAQLKNATNDIKSEIHKGVDANGMGDSINELRGTFTTEVDKVKDSLEANLNSPIEKINQDIEELKGPIKRQL
jgi:sec-independent protein translocase protein TatA